jgi:hypothetical protein
LEGTAVTGGLPAVDSRRREEVGFDRMTRLLILVGLKDSSRVSRIAGRGAGNPSLPGRTLPNESARFLHARVRSAPGARTGAGARQPERQWSESYHRRGRGRAARPPFDESGPPTGNGSGSGPGLGRRLRWDRVMVSKRDSPQGRRFDLANGLASRPGVVRATVGAGRMRVSTHITRPEVSGRPIPIDNTRIINRAKDQGKRRTACGARTHDRPAPRRGVRGGTAIQGRPGPPPPWR